MICNFTLAEEEVGGGAGREGPRGAGTGEAGKASPHNFRGGGNISIASPKGMFPPLKLLGAGLP